MRSVPHGSFGPRLHVVTIGSPRVAQPPSYVGFCSVCRKADRLLSARNGHPKRSPECPVSTHCGHNAPPGTPQSFSERLEKPWPTFSRHPFGAVLSYLYVRSRFGASAFVSKYRATRGTLRCSTSPWTANCVAVTLSRFELVTWWRARRLEVAGPSSSRRPVVRFNLRLLNKPGDRSRHGLNAARAARRTGYFPVG